MIRKISSVFFVISTALICMGAAFQFGGIRHDITSQITDNSLVIMNNASTQVQRFTGSSGNFINLPSATTLRNGFWYLFINDSSSAISVRNNSGSELGTVTAASSGDAGAALAYLATNGTSAGTWAFSPFGGAGGGGAGPRDSIKMTTNASFGSTATKIVEFTVTESSTGSAISVTTNSTDGTYFTINEDGVYAISYSVAYATTGRMGISINSAQLTTDIQSITAANRITAADAGSSGVAVTQAWTGILSATDVIRIHGQGGTLDSVDPQLSTVTITKVAD